MISEALSAYAIGTRVLDERRASTVGASEVGQYARAPSVSGARTTSRKSTRGSASPMPNASSPSGASRPRRSAGPTTTCSASCRLTKSGHEGEAS
jgi:hypothetical protein